ncbi:hypothetical protein QQF64_030190 [Cirrhinus molitorella]|uniref:Uncharacterized protein n=1 Tax=Cirrhinus molitorella TaxID=172907 RepID=A0ABR3N2Q5_9TELE
MDVLLAAIEILTNPSGHQEHLIKVNEEKPDPSPPSCDHPSVLGICVELKKDDDVRDEEVSDICPANQDSTMLTDGEESWVSKQETEYKIQDPHLEGGDGRIRGGDG